ncbi:MAG TPA: hypothetical protein VH880_01615 [Anaeromyxobacteraceae bacterium]|jgi:uncharacterized protein (TIGR03382 family)
MRVRPLAALAALAAAPALLAPAAGRAYVRSTTVSGHPEQGLCLWWGKRTVPFRVNASQFLSVPGCADGGAAAALAAASFPAWGQATRAGEAQPCTDFAFAAGPATAQTASGNDGVNLVVFRVGLCLDVAAGDPCLGSPGACAAKFNCWEHDPVDPGSSLATIALTTVSYDPASGEILDADMELHGWNGASGGPAGLPRGTYFTCADPPAATCAYPPYLPPQGGCIWIDVGDVAAHEAGHMLGLDHTCSYPPPYDSCSNPGENTMDPTMVPGETAKRTLSQDDVAGVCAAYPAGAATATCAPPAGTKGAGGCGCGAGGPGVAPLLAAALLLARSWRRRGRR